MLRAIASYANNDRAQFIKAITEATDEKQASEITSKRKRLEVAKSRVQELETLICRIYEDSILGKLPPDRYTTLDNQYAKEQESLEKEIQELKTNIASLEKNYKSSDKFISLIDKYENFDTLTVTMLNEFVKKILVHERDRKGSTQTTQQVEIFFNFVGKYVPPHFKEENLTIKEQEELRRKEERKDRLHQNYIRRRDRGKVAKEYEQAKERKKAEIAAMNNALREEDIARGVFVPVSTLPKAEPKVAEKVAWMPLDLNASKVKLQNLINAKLKKERLPVYQFVTPRTLAVQWRQSCSMLSQISANSVNYYRVRRIIALRVSTIINHLPIVTHKFKDIVKQ